jgi:hypothetical protein
MADTKLTALTADTTPAATGLLYYVDDPGGTPVSRKTTVSEMNVFMNSLAASFGPDGTMKNGKITVTVASNNITVALKTLAGSDPSASDPVYVRINGTIRTCTAALAVTKNAATNWFNSGGAELATKEIDYFAYLIWNTTPATDIVDIGFARAPYFSVYSEASATTTNEKYLAYANGSAPTSTDDMVVIGRFAATLSATAAFNWSVPTFTNINLIQRPIFETRWLIWAPVTTCSGSLTYGTITNSVVYKIINDRLMYTLIQTGTLGGSASNTIYNTVPFESLQAATNNVGGGFGTTAGGLSASVVITAGTPDLIQCRRYDIGNYGTSGSNTNTLQGIYQI